MFAVVVLPEAVGLTAALSGNDDAVAVFDADLRYKAVSRVRRKIEDELTEDVTVLRENHPELYEELRAVVCEWFTTSRRCSNLPDSHNNSELYTSRPPFELTGYRPLFYPPLLLQYVYYCVYPPLIE